MSIDARPSDAERGRGLVVRHAVAADGEAVSGIYNHYVAHTHVTFEEDRVSMRDMARRIQGIADAGFPWLVADRSGQLARDPGR
jgi:L-amino acid N-acyltransferase YncA